LSVRYLTKYLGVLAGWIFFLVIGVDKEVQIYLMSGYSSRRKTL
jgi:hypothetical protein